MRRLLAASAVLCATAVVACGGRRVTQAEPPPPAPVRPHVGTPGALAEPHAGGEIDALVGASGGSIAACANGRHGSVTIAVTFREDGHVVDESIASGDFQGGAAVEGTLEAGCMLAVAHELTVAPFEGESRHESLSFRF